MTKCVYLAGPIKGLTYTDATEWREYAKQYLQKYGIITVSPMRFKTYLSTENKMPDSVEQLPLSSEKGITTRDRNDVLTSDLVLANFLGAVVASCGTPIEFGWADAWRKPIVMVMEKTHNPFDHGMMRSLAGFRVETLNEGLMIVRALLE